MTQHNTLKIKALLTGAVATISLALASAASAVNMNAADGGTAVAHPAPVPVANPGGFNWGNLTIGVLVALGAALFVVAAVSVVRRSGRLAASH